MSPFKQLLLLFGFEKGLKRDSFSLLLFKKTNDSHLSLCHLIFFASLVLYLFIKHNIRTLFLLVAFQRQLWRNRHLIHHFEIHKRLFKNHKTFSTNWNFPRSRKVYHNHHWPAQYNLPKRYHLCRFPGQHKHTKSPLRSMPETG